MVMLDKTMLSDGVRGLGLKAQVSPLTRCETWGKSLALYLSFDSGSFAW